MSFLDVPEIGSSVICNFYVPGQNFPRIIVIIMKVGASKALLVLVGTRGSLVNVGYCNLT